MTRVLVLTPRFPYPMDSGDKLRIAEICRALSLKAEVTLLSICDDRAQLATPLPTDVAVREERIYLPRWKSRLQTIAALFSRTPLQIAYYRDARFARLVERHAPGHDVVVAHLIRTAPAAIETHLPRVLEMTDSPSLFYGRTRSSGQAGSLKALAYRFEAARVADYESGVCRRFDLTAVVSTFDRSHLLSRGIEPWRVLAVGNGVDLDRRVVARAKSANELFFVGNMRTLQNQDSCRYVIDELLPRLNKVRPFKLRVVGAVPEAVDSLTNSPDVVLHGFADDLADAARNALCGICVMRVAAGIQNKILDYMSIGLPTVVNGMALEGLAAQPETDLILAEGPDAQVAAILRLSDDEAHWQRLSASSVAYVHSHHDWTATLSPLVDRVLAVAAHELGNEPGGIT